jgi:hypothetical protein
LKLFVLLVSSLSYQVGGNFQRHKGLLFSHYRLKLFVLLVSSLSYQVGGNFQRHKGLLFSHYRLKLFVLLVSSLSYQVGGNFQRHKGLLFSHYRLKLFVLLVRLIPLHLLADQSSETTTATRMSMCLSALLRQLDKNWCVQHGMAMDKEEVAG